VGNFDNVMELRCVTIFIFYWLIIREFKDDD